MLIETLQVKDKTVEIYTEDDFSLNPREWDNLGTMVCFHRRYILGDENHEFVSCGPEVFADFIANEKEIIALPLILLDHSGLWMKTTSFSCDPGGWDSGLVGYIYVTYENIRKEFNVKNVTEKVIEKVKSSIQSEVEIYSMYLEGRVYFFYSTCNRCGEDNSCGGFYGENWKENGLLDYVDGYCQCIERQYVESMAIKE